MALPSSGSISMSQIRSEFPGDSTPNQLSEFYRNGTYVKNWAAAQNIPTDGTIAYSNFRGTSASSNLNDDQIQQYIWDNKASLWRAFLRGATTTNGNTGIQTVGGQYATYKYNPHPRAGEPSGNLAFYVNTRGTINGVADFTDAQSLVYLGPTTSFVFISNSYGHSGTIVIRAWDKNNNEVPLEQIYRSSPTGSPTDGGRGEIHLLRCNTTDYTSFGYVTISGAGGTGRDTPSFGSIFMLPGAYDVWSAETVAVTNPATAPSYVTITNPPRGFTVLHGSGQDYDAGDGWFLNSSSQNAAGNPNPIESASRKYIKFNVFWYGNVTAAMLIGTGGYEDTTWKHKIGTNLFTPFGRGDRRWRLTKMYRVGN